MAEEGKPEEHDDGPLLFDELHDQLERFQVLRTSDPDASDALLDDLGAKTDIDRDIVGQLAAMRPLARPERFIAAHSLAMHALEVLARNGGRAVPVPGVGILKPVVHWPIQQVCKFIVRNHLARLVDAVGDLYARRLGWTPSGDPMRLPLLKANRDIGRIVGTFERNSAPLPTFLLGGAVVSGFGSGVGALGDAAFDNIAGATVAVAVVTLVFAFVAACIIRGAAVAHRRIGLTVERPMKALYETVGAAGNPPADQARLVALWGVILTAASWVIVPAGVVFVLSRL